MMIVMLVNGLQSKAGKYSFGRESHVVWNSPYAAKHLPPHPKQVTNKRKEMIRAFIRAANLGIWGDRGNVIRRIPHRNPKHSLYSCVFL